MFQAVPLPIIRSTNLYIQRQVLSNQYCSLLLSWMRWNLRVSGGSSAHHQAHKTVHTASGIVKPIVLLSWMRWNLHVSGGSSAHHQVHKTVHTAAGIVKPIVLLSWMRWNLSSISSTIAAGSNIGLTIPAAVCTVLCSWWWAEEPPETCRAIYRNK